MIHLQPLVSLLVPVYGVEPYIERCARALFGQTYANIEYIFVDDCSPDGSIALLERVLAEFPERVPQVRIVRHERNRGLAAARNTAFECAAGEWVLMHDSDDWLELEAVERLVGAVEEGVDMVACNFYRGPYPCNTDVWVQRQRPANGVEWLKLCLCGSGDNTWAVWNKLLRRSLFDNPGVCWTEGADMAEDFKIMACLSCHIRGVKHVEAPLVHYLTRPGSFSYEKISRSKERNVCTNVADSVAYIRKTGMYEEFRPVLTSYLIRHRYDLLFRVGLDRKECLDMLPKPKHWMLKRGLGLSFRKRLVVYCGIRGWKVPTLALLTISGRWRRLRRRK